MDAGIARIRHFGPHNWQLACLAHAQAGQCVTHEPLLKHKLTDLMSDVYHAVFPAWLCKVSERQFELPGPMDLLCFAGNIFWAHYWAVGHPTNPS